MTTLTGSASGKIILTGEYAVLFGHRGIAVPSKEKISVHMEKTSKPLHIEWDTDDRWIAYAQKILKLLGQETGNLTIKSELRLGKGMGSSTALVIALSRCVLGKDCKDQAFAIENEMNPGHSGIDFAVIWADRPVLFKKGTVPELITLPDVLAGSTLIDTGVPTETTRELIAWMTARGGEIKGSIDTIGACTERLIRGESLKTILHDHHRAQVALGVVPEATQKVIDDIEASGGAAKVIGAGARTGGGGMVLAFS